MKSKTKIEKPETEKTKIELCWNCGERLTKDELKRIGKLCFDCEFRALEPDEPNDFDEFETFSNANGTNNKFHKLN